MSNIIDLATERSRRRPSVLPAGTLALVALDRDIADLEAWVYDATICLPHLRGQQAASLARSIADSRVELGELERRRKVLAGPELAVLKGGLE